MSSRAQRGTFNQRRSKVPRCARDDIWVDRCSLFNDPTNFEIGTLVSLLESPRRRARPVRMQAAERDARCLPHPFGLGSTMHTAETRRSNATGPLYNYSALQSITVIMISQFRFRDFWRSIEGPIWRVVRATTPSLVSLRPSASNAFKPASLLAQPRSCRTLTRLNTNPSKPL